MKPRGNVEKRQPVKASKPVAWWRLAEKAGPQARDEAPGNKHDGRYHDVDLNNPDFVQLAAAYGAEVWLRHRGVAIPGASAALRPAAALAGLAGVFCSVMIYVDTRRAFWSLPLVGFKFFMTGVVLGVPAAAAQEAIRSPSPSRAARRRT